MSDRLDWNAKTIAEFRANEGRVGGSFEGAPMVLVHHRGRKAGGRTSLRPCGPVGGGPHAPTPSGKTDRNLKSLRHHRHEGLGVGAVTEREVVNHV